MPLPGIIFKSKSGSRSSGTPEKPGERQSRGDERKGEVTRAKERRGEERGEVTRTKERRGEEREEIRA